MKITVGDNYCITVDSERHHHPPMLRRLYQSTLVATTAAAKMPTCKVVVKVVEVKNMDGNGFLLLLLILH